VLVARVLGELEVEVDGRRIEPPPSRRAWSLLAWLAMHPGDHARGAVAARFWPDVLDASARASLRSAVWTLRKMLGDAGESAVIAGRDRIGLRCETDLRAFEARVAAGQLADAVALWRGPLLADLDDDWVLEQRDEQHERLGAVLARLSDEAPTPADAISFARRRLTLDPLDEAAARDLARALVAAGDRAGALAVYDRLSERLRTGLGLAPSAETRALAAEIRAPEPDTEPATAAAAAWAQPPSDATTIAADAPPLIGRRAELERILSLWEQVRGGRGAVVLISGEGGIGKTRLASELVSRARIAGACCTSCVALDLGGAPPPFGLWAELLAGVATELAAPDADAHWPEELARLAPALPRRLGRAAAAPAEVTPELARARMFEATVELAEHAAAERPFLAVFDDVHLADAPSLELAGYLARRIAAMPVMLVLTRRRTPRRDEVDALAHAASARGAIAEEIELEPLGRIDVERLIGATATLTAPVRERVIAAADGNPLLAIESARAVARGDRDLASSLRATVRAAVAGLPEDARRAAELAAVAGRDLERVELVALVAPEAMLGAIDSGLFRSADGRLGFRHALLREAVYADLDDVRRRTLHEELGRSLAGRAAEAARHLRLAGRDDLAVDRLLDAAADAMRATAFHEAATFLVEAIDLAPDNAAARLELADAYAQLGRREDSIAALEAGIDLVPAADAAARAAAHLRSARWFRGALCDPGSGRSAAQAGLDALDAGGLSAPEQRAELLLLRAWAEVTISGADAADASLSEVGGLGLDLGRAGLLRHDVTSVRGHIALAAGRLAEAEEQLVASGIAGEMVGRRDMAYGGWSNAACIAAAAGAFDRALAHSEHGAKVVSGLPTLELQMLSVHASVLSLLGRHDEALADCERQRELADRLGSAKLAALADHDAGLLALAAGDFERAQRLLAQALAGNPPIQRAEARLRRAEALARLGRADEADAEIRATTAERVLPSHRPAVLVARMAFAQALSAPHHLASLVDLGRPPVTGVVDPDRELERVAAELRELQPVPT
jgi:DNA-binding SARP family transcriptional activator